MSTMVNIKDLSDQDMFELQNGSVFIMQRRTADTNTHQAHIWCAHAPDTMTSEPSLIDFLPELQVRRLAGNETREHYAHEGYVKAVFAREMDHRHLMAMIPVTDRMQQEAVERHLRDLAERPWWKKILG